MGLRKPQSKIKTTLSGTTIQPQTIQGEDINVVGYLSPLNASKASIVQPSIENNFKLSNIDVPSSFPLLDASEKISTPKINEPKKITAAEAIQEQNQIFKDQSTDYNKGQLAASALKFGIDILNANNKYKAIEGAARFNILQARNQAADAVYRGRQAGFQRQSEARLASEDATLALAAQGQGVNSTGVQKVQGSYEAVGYQNALLEEINGVREALGYELEEIKTNYELQNAKTERDFSMLSSAANLGVDYYKFRG